MNTRRKGFTLVELMIVIAILGILLALVVGGVGGCSVSDGTRTGVVTKFSNKGLVAKSWEGEMVMGGARLRRSSEGTVSSVANIWQFTVTDKSLVPAIQAAVESGEPISVKYHQTFGHNPFTRDTSYTIVGVVTNKLER